MKKFRVEGWFRIEDEKNYINSYHFGENSNEAIEYFKLKYRNAYFYKITVEEI